MTRYIILTVGYTHSGKTTFARKLTEKCPDMIGLERDPIAAMLHQDFPVLKRIDLNNRQSSDKTIKDKIYDLLLCEAIDHNLNIVISTCNSTRQTRSKIIERYKAQIPDARFIMVYFDIDMSILEDRTQQSARSTDVLAVSKDFRESLEKQKSFFDVPTEDECDFFLTIHNNTNTDNVLACVERLLYSPSHLN